MGRLSCPKEVKCDSWNFLTDAYMTSTWWRISLRYIALGAAGRSMNNGLDESSIEQLALDELGVLGWHAFFGPDIAPDGPWPERERYSDVVLVGRLREALERINPQLPPVAIEEALRQVLTSDSPALIENNRRFHRMLTDGVDVSWMGPEGEKHGKVWLLDIDHPENNDWLAVNQFTVVENKKERRPDIVLFVNGLPLVVVELKNPGAVQASLRSAFNQLQTYKEEIPSLFAYNELLIISDGMQARFGTLTSGWDRFMPWRTIDGTDLYREPGNEKQSEGVLQAGITTLLRGMLEPRRFLDYVLNFITFEDNGGGTVHVAKKAAGYHQYHAVNQALASTLVACGIEGDPNALYARFIEAEAADPFSVKERSPEYGTRFGDRRAGVIWHTQGSGKSLSMVFYAGKVIRHPAMENP